ncbi:hypothetical protein NCR96_08670 [Helicobacter sp. 14348-15]|uniref:hypothetical protein n=1 Tax=Helicobacter colisuis TaxID=2949739 RepID=UPI00202B3A72|nr:hypothetical protein [Helicobacter colisuis]MCL9821804.1 hypothetical protein [Helicobacter colisuis]
MSETYQITAPNSVILNVDKQSNEIIFEKWEKETGKYTERYSKALLDAWQIMESSPYKDYKPLYLDPELKTGESSTYLEFKAWQELYLKEPQKGAIAPWTKAEKAYYQSLKTKRERYKYLVIRSGLRSSIIDIPYDAYCNVDENGKLIKEEYKELYAKVEANRNNIILNDFFGGEWGIAAGILGNSWGFVQGAGVTKSGFKARGMQSIFLALQLGVESSFEQLQDALLYWGLSAGMHINKLRALQIKEFAKNAPYDEFGMLPYLDELIGVDWVMDFNMLYRYAVDEGSAIRNLSQQIKQGKLKDPRDVDSTPESREEFHKKSRAVLANNLEHYELDIPNEYTEKEARLYIDTLLLEAKVMAITPKQGYPNAPTYYVPEDLEATYKDHKLDKLLNPTIPAIYRYNFPESLRVKIKTYAKEHNIKE